MSAHNNLSTRVIVMENLWAEQALTPDGWAKAVRIDLDAAGKIAAVTPDQPPVGQRLGMVLPAPGNLHSHTFQRAMAGLSEARGKNASDSFWTWRTLMYAFLDRLTPDDIQAVAAFAQMEMLETGFASVGEFHYLHHGIDGVRYDNIAETSLRIFAAANTSGIGLTHLPVLYSVGGCDGRALQGGQRRFGNDFNAYQALFDAAKAGMSDLPDDRNIGVAPHSLRAVSRNDLAQVAALHTGGPVHIHLAEQVAEVAEVTAAWGARPVSWLLGHANVNARWCAIHLTQMNAVETAAFARSGAVAGLCPITESSLGDGIFDGVAYLGHGGRFGVGSDSNIQISVAGELRTLEYSQRLRDRSRAALARSDASTGRVLFEGAAKGSAQALGRKSGALVPGNWADLLELDTTHVDLAGLSGDHVLDTWIFAGQRAMVRNVWAAGRHVVRDGCHRDRDRITKQYRRVMTAIRAAL